MKPADICNQILGTDKLHAALDELSSSQVKAVLKQGDLRVKLPGGYVSQHKRRALWSERICSSVQQGNDSTAAEILQQWLLHHRRAMLIDFLNRLEIRHRDGETDVSFLLDAPAERVREAATWLLARYDHGEAVAYLIYIAYQQRSSVFDGWDGLRLTEPASNEAPAMGETPVPA